MKKLLVTVFALFSISLFAQDEFVEYDNFPMSIGPYLDYTLGINGVDTPEGRKNGIAMAALPNVGFTFYLPLSEESRLGMLYDLGLSNYAFNIEDVRDGTTYLHNFSYLNLAVQYYFHGLTTGFRFGTPLFADIDDNEIKTDNLNINAEFIIGGSFPIYYDETGSFTLYFRFGYMLNGIFDNFKEDDPLRGTIPAVPNYPIDNSFNPRAASFSLGFNYNFFLK